MKKLSIALTALLLLACIITCIGCNANTNVVTPTPILTLTGVDDMGRPFDFATPPQRIVSPAPSITETLFALGLDNSIVGVSDYCDYPAAAKTKPSVGGYFDPSLEAIVALKPDLVLTDGYSETPYGQLESLGIPVVVLQPADINGIYHDIQLLGNITGTEQSAEQLISNMQGSIDSTVSIVGNATTRPRVFYVYDASDTTKPWTAGPGSFIDDLINLAGGKNVAGNATGPWVQFSMEELAESDPEIIILDSTMGTMISLEQLQELPVWQDLTAVKEGQVYTIDGDLVDRTGPRIVQGLEDLAKFIHPDLFNVVTPTPTPTPTPVSTPTPSPT